MKSMRMTPRHVAIAFAGGLLMFGCAHPNLHSMLVVPKPDPSCSAVPSGVEDLRDLLEPMRRELHLPALAAAVVSPAEVVALGVVGVRSTLSTTPVCVTDAFHLGSDTKAMTAVVIARLVEQGKLHWNATIHSVLGDTPGQDPIYRDVTLEQLLAHRAGLAHDPQTLSPDQQRALPGDLHAQREAYVTAGLREPPINAPGSAYAYSNTGYVIAGLMAERVTERTWEQLVREFVFAPLAMPNAGFGITASFAHVDGPWAHRMERDEPVPIWPGPRSDNAPVMAPAGGIHTSIEGWARFVADALAGLEGHGRLLAPASYAKLFEPPFSDGYAHGWQRLQRDFAGGDVYTHAGSNTLNFAVAWLLPKKRVAILVATNIGFEGAPQACDSVVSMLLRWSQTRSKLPHAIANER
jgi:CubicO group peptidase (beta-lactamase class C family)